ncbi:MAG: type I methionyl aminopeptidase [Erysipelothrix sp.]|nr:type I methionyl aminopeptidase [Erysipelothrix sp.]
MIHLKSKREIQEMKKAGELLAYIHSQIKEMIKPGVTTWEIDQLSHKIMKDHGAIAQQIGYNGYKYATCASINDEICHGFPRKKPLLEGDIVTIDMVVNLNGYLADSAWSYGVGLIDDKAQQLLDVTKKSLYLGIEQAQVNNRTGVIGHAIQSYVEPLGYSVVREFSGHGIGQDMHEDPMILHYGKANKGVRLQEGMVITIEPMINIGHWKSSLDDDGWTARTIDGSLSAQFEHTIAITAEGPLILTEQK